MAGEKMPNLKMLRIIKWVQSPNWFIVHWTWPLASFMKYHKKAKRFCINVIIVFWLLCYCFSGKCESSTTAASAVDFLQCLHWNCWSTVLLCHQRHFESTQRSIHNYVVTHISGKNRTEALKTLQVSVRLCSRPKLTLCQKNFDLSETAVLVRQGAQHLPQCNVTSSSNVLHWVMGYVHAHKIIQYSFLHYCTVDKFIIQSKKCLGLVCKIYMQYWRKKQYGTRYCMDVIATYWNINHIVVQTVCM